MFSIGCVLVAPKRIREMFRSTRRFVYCDQSHPNTNVCCLIKEYEYYYSTFIQRSIYKLTCSNALLT